MPDRVVIFVVMALAIIMFGGTLGRLGRPEAVQVVAIESLMKAEPARVLPEADLVAPDGAKTRLSAYAGKPLVLTFWASWCAPCLRELPTLARFKPRAEAAGINVATVSEDKEGAAVAKGYMDGNGLGALPLFVDPDGELAKALGVKGLPTTLIIDAEGREVARIQAEADWSGPDVVSVISTVLGR